MICRYASQKPSAFPLSRRTFRQFFPHRLHHGAELCGIGENRDVQHRLRAIVGRLGGSTRHEAPCRGDILDHEARAVYAAENPLAVVEDEPAHHGDSADFRQRRQLGRDEIRQLAIRHALPQILDAPGDIRGKLLVRERRVAGALPKAARQVGTLRAVPQALFLPHTGVNRARAARRRMKHAPLTFVAAPAQSPKE